MSKCRFLYESLIEQGIEQKFLAKKPVGDDKFKLLDSRKGVSLGSYFQNRFEKTYGVQIENPVSGDAIDFSRFKKVEQGLRRKAMEKTEGFEFYKPFRDGRRILQLTPAEAIQLFVFRNRSANISVYTPDNLVKANHTTKAANIMESPQSKELKSLISFVKEATYPELTALSFDFGEMMKQNSEFLKEFNMDPITHNKSDKAVLDDILQKYGSEDQKILNRYMDQVFSATDTYIDYIINREAAHNGAGGSATYGELTVNPYAHGSYSTQAGFEGVARTYTHEKVHHSTVILYETNKKFAKKIDEMYFLAKKVNNDKKKYYGLESPLEFMAESLSNPEFQDFLNNIILEDGNKTILERLFEVFANALKNVIPNFRNDSLLSEVLTTTIEEIARSSERREAINGLSLKDGKIFEAIGADGTVTIGDNGIDESHLSAFARKNGVDLLEISGTKGIYQFGKFNRIGPSTKFTRYELHSFLADKAVGGDLIASDHMAEILSPYVTFKDQYINYKMHTSTDQIGTLQDISDSIGESIQKPSDENGGKYFIDNEPHWRATSYLGFDSADMDPILGMNSSRLGNIVDEVGKRVFRGDDVATITHSDVLKFVQAEDNEYTWSRQPISQNDFSTLVNAMIDAKQDLIDKYGFVKFHTDLIFWDKKLLVAGEADVVGVLPDGSNTVIDLKTRRKGLVDYDVRYKNNWSVKEKHTKQTNLYSDMASEIFFETYNPPIILMMSGQYSGTSEIEDATFTPIEGDSLYSLIELERRRDYFAFGTNEKKLREAISEKRKDYNTWYSNKLKTERPEMFKENVEKHVKVLQEKLEELNETLEQYLNISRGSKDPNIVKLGKIRDDLKDKLDRELENVSIQEQLTIVSDFFDFSVQEVKKIGNDLSVDLLGDDIESEISAYQKAQKYRGVFDLARELYEDIESVSQYLPDASEFQELRDGYKELQGVLGETDAKIQSKLNSLTASILKNSYLGSKAEIKYKDEFTLEGRRVAKEQNPSASAKEIKRLTEEYVNKKLRSTEVQEELMVEYHKEIEELMSITADDMKGVSMYLLSDASISNSYVQLMHSLLVKSKQQFSVHINERFIDIDKKYKELKLSKAEVRDLMTPDKDGNYILKNKYKFGFVEEITDLQVKLYELKNNEGTPEEINLQQALIKQWYKDNTTIVDNRSMPSDKWLNPEYSALSARQKEAIDYFQSISHKNDTEKIGVMSLGVTKSNNTWYRVPGVLATDFEQLSRGNFLAGVKKAFNEATTIEADDTDYGGLRETTNDTNDVKYVYSGLDGSPIMTVPIHFRARLGEKQSTDLFSVYAMEAANGIRYDHDNRTASKGQIIVDFVDSKKFNAVEGFSKRKSMSIFRPKDSKVVDTLEGEASVVSAQLKKMLKNQVYSILHEYAGSVSIAGKEFDVNRIAGFISSYTAMANMGFKLLGAANNWMTGNVALIVEAAGGEFITPADLLKAKQIYNSNLLSLARDAGSPVQTSFINQLMRYFDVQSEMGALDNRFERDNKVTQHLKTGSAMALYSMGEHEIHATMMLALLNSQKMLNKDGEYLNLNGEVVETKDEAASMLDIFSLNDKGVIDIENWAKGNVYNTHETIEDLTTGGLGKMRLLIKDRIIRTQGAYGKDTASAMDRFWYGKLFKQFKKHIVPQTLNRFRGLNHAGKQKGEIPENKRYYNYTTKTDENGYYVSFLRYVLNMIKVAKYDILSYKRIGKDNWGHLAEHEQANIRKTMTELSYIMTTLILAGLAAGAAADDDDNWFLYSSAYLMRRQMSDAGLAYYDPSEAWRLTDSPMAAIRQLNAIREAVTYMAPWNWDEEYESGYNKGKNKALVKFKKAALLDRMVQFDEGFMKRKYTNLDSH